MCSGVLPTSLTALMSAPYSSSISTICTAPWLHARCSSVRCDESRSPTGEPACSSSETHCALPVVVHRRQSLTMRQSDERRSGHLVHVLAEHGRTAQARLGQWRHVTLVADVRRRAQLQEGLDDGVAQ